MANTSLRKNGRTIESNMLKIVINLVATVFAWCTSFSLVFVPFKPLPASHDFCCLYLSSVYVLGNRYCKQYGPRSDCSRWCSLI